MFLKRKFKKYHTINNPLTITDPCYDKDVWCRINDVKVRPGEYRVEYYVGANPDKEDIQRLKGYAKEYGTSEKDEIARFTRDIQSRVFTLCIQLKGRGFGLNFVKWEKLGSIGVDAGVAGFFWNKPDFSDDEWSEFCDFMREKRASGQLLYFDPKYGFWCDSGYGDGCYPVSVIKENDEIIAIKIEF